LTRGAAVRIRPLMDAAELIAFAEELAAAARQETLHRWAAGCAVEDKGSGVFDPVTEADREAERVMRALTRERYPDHGITGEEWPDEPGSTAYRWSLDPVDGTRSFMCGLPTWTTLIALLDDGAPALGLIDAPVLDETYIGAGDDAWMVRHGERTVLRTSGCMRLADARFSTTDPFLWAPPADALQAILSAVRVTRYGHDGYGYARLAGGSIDLVIESGLKPHDYNALIPVVRAAGGHIGNWHGGTDFAAGQVIAAATLQLYDEAVELLSA
jgi:histidinol phosphatase-like enzyme (inositol monophosphatase family)